MIVLDTNVVSSAMAMKPDLYVAQWLDQQDWNALYLCAPVLAELRFGVESLDRGRRRAFLIESIDRLESDFYRGRILPFDAVAAAHYGRVVADRKRKGRRIEPMDGLIASIALAHGASVATRDVDDFSGIGLDVINPFNWR